MGEAQLVEFFTVRVGGEDGGVGVFALRTEFAGTRRGEVAARDLGHQRVVRRFFFFLRVSLF